MITEYNCYSIISATRNNGQKHAVWSFPHNS